MIRALIDKARRVIVTACGTGSWEGFKEPYLAISGESERYLKAPDMIQHSHLSDFKSSSKAWRKICSSRGLRYAGNRAAHLTNDNVRIWEAILECQQSVANQATLKNIFEFAFPGHVNRPE